MVITWRWKKTYHHLAGGWVCLHSQLLKFLPCSQLTVQVLNVPGLVSPPIRTSLNFLEMSWESSFSFFVLFWVWLRLSICGTNLNNKQNNLWKTNNLHLYLAKVIVYPKASTESREFKHVTAELYKRQSQQHLFLLSKHLLGITIYHSRCWKAEGTTQKGPAS